MKITTCTIVIIITFQTLLLGQSAKIDSLNQLLLDEIIDKKSQVDILNELAFALHRSDLEKTFRLALQARDIAEKIKYPAGQAESFRIVGVYHWQKADYLKASFYLDSALNLFEKKVDKAGTARVLNNIGNNFKPLIWVYGCCYCDCCGTCASELISLLSYKKNFRNKHYNFEGF